MAGIARGFHGGRGEADEGMWILGSGWPLSWQPGLGDRAGLRLGVGVQRGCGAVGSGPLGLVEYEQAGPN